MIFEVTRDYSIIVPLMISNLIAYYISYQLQREPIYEALARQDGIHLPAADARWQPAKSQVAAVMRPPSTAFSRDTSLETALESMRTGSLDIWPVVDQEGLCGMIRREELETAAASGKSTGSGSPAFSIHFAVTSMVQGSRIFIGSRSLPGALADGVEGLRVMPVVSRADVRELVGIAELDDILDAYGVNKRGKVAR